MLEASLGLGFVEVHFFFALSQDISICQFFVSKMKNEYKLVPIHFF